jgi:hypothetical protein
VSWSRSAELAAAVIGRICSLSSPPPRQVGWLCRLRSRAEEMRCFPMFQLGRICGTDPALPGSDVSPLHDALNAVTAAARRHHRLQARASRPVAAAGPVQPGPPPRARLRRLSIRRQPRYCHAGAPTDLTMTIMVSLAPRAAAP